MKALLRALALIAAPGVLLAQTQSTELHIRYNSGQSVVPVYEELPGWLAPTTGVRRPEDLPKAARRYIDRLAELSGAPIDLVSVGASRDQTIWLDPSRLGPVEPVGQHQEEAGRHRQVPQR